MTLKEQSSEIGIQLFSQLDNVIKKQMRQRTASVIENVFRDLSRNLYIYIVYSGWMNKTSTADYITYVQIMTRVQYTYHFLH